MNKNRKASWWSTHDLERRLRNAAAWMIENIDPNLSKSGLGRFYIEEGLKAHEVVYNKGKPFPNARPGKLRSGPRVKKAKPKFDYAVSKEEKRRKFHKKQIRKVKTSIRMRLKREAKGEE